MKLLRLAVVLATSGANRETKIAFPCFSTESVRVEVLDHYQTTVDPSWRFLVGATVTLPTQLELTGEGLLILPQEERRRAEYAIEISANLMAVTEGIGRSISSPTPCVGLQAETPEEEDFVKRVKGMAAGIHNLTSAKAAIDSEALRQVLDDRLDGIALLAEALSAGNSIGEFRDLVRVFERAFALGGYRLVAPLTEFLSTADRLGYTQEEVEEFIKHARDAVTHADGLLRNEFFLEADVRPLVWRMRQAAYDVLFNKEAWQEPSTSRRDVWRPLAGTSEPNVPFLVRGTNAAVDHQLLDEYGVFPLDLSNSANQVPAGWWNWMPAGKVSTGSLEIRESRESSQPAND